MPVTTRLVGEAHVKGRDAGRGRARSARVGRRSTEQTSHGEPTRSRCMTRDVIVCRVAAIACRSSAQLGKLKGVADKAAKAYDDLTFTDEEEQQLGVGDQREAAREVRRRAGPRRAQVRGAGRHRCWRSASTRPESALDVRRARHRRRQRVCRARRLRPHHARRAGADSERGRAGRRARPRDRARHGEAHDQRDQEGEGALARSPSATRAGFIEAAGQQGATRSSLENNFDRDDERRPTRSGSILANKVGLRADRAGRVSHASLSERNKGLKERSGMFASHPETKARLERSDEVRSRRRSSPPRRWSRRAYVAVDHVQAGAGRPDRAGRAAHGRGRRPPSREIRRRRASSASAG